MHLLPPLLWSTNLELPQKLIGKVLDGEMKFGSLGIYNGVYKMRSVIWIGLIIYNTLMFRGHFNRQLPFTVVSQRLPFPLHKLVLYVTLLSQHFHSQTTPPLNHRPLGKIEAYNLNLFCLGKINSWRLGNHKSPLRLCLSSMFATPSFKYLFVLCVCIAINYNAISKNRMWSFFRAS
ncbi:hypothetical protein LXL04_036498 [Taraxacum kok-saghyz]